MNAAKPDAGRSGRGSMARRGVPKGIRTPVTAVKGQCPRPLDDGDKDGHITLLSFDCLQIFFLHQMLSLLSLVPCVRLKHRCRRSGAHFIDGPYSCQPLFKNFLKKGAFWGNSPFFYF